eukprot:3445608-Prymnesium_polylepis.2
MIDPSFGEASPGSDPKLCMPESSSGQCVRNPIFVRHMRDSKRRGDEWLQAAFPCRCCAFCPLSVVGQPLRFTESKLASDEAQIKAILPTIRALLDANVTLFTTHSPDVAAALGIPDVVRKVGFLSPAAYLDLLADMAFALGLGHTHYSPAPLDALANGAAFLNPTFHEPLPSWYLDKYGGSTTAATQNDALQRLAEAHSADSTGEPYVFRVDFQQPETVVAAALQTVEAKNRFSAFQPPEMSRSKPTSACRALTLAVGAAA